MTTTLDIQLWLRQVAVWRFVGFFSTVVGLVCYARSSSFTILFGEWNLSKITLYSVFSLLVCFWSLNAKLCPRSTSIRFKAHIAVLVLTITSVYSYFADKAGNGKPDVYSLISCVSFAIMSFSLSRQTQCGFEVDLSNFFLGVLILLLMKIKLALAIVGVGFSYALIILRSSLDTTSYENHRIQVDHTVVIDIDHASMMQHLVDCVNALGKENSNLANMLFNYVKECEARNEGKEEQIPVALPVPDFDIFIDALQSGTINDLHEIAKRMVASGFGKECSQVYSSCRREFLEESVSRLGLQKLSIEDVHKMTWQDLEDEIKKWITASNVTLKILFPSERRLCDRIFFGFASSADFSFMEVCRGFAIQLLNFADAVAIGSRSPERLFRMLDVFETLRDLIPEFETLFSDEFSLSLRNEAITIWKRLGESIRGIFMELENLIRRDPAKRAVPGGGLHPITRYVMNYLLLACESRQSLEQVFENDGLKEYTKLDDRVPSSSSLSAQMNSIMELLESSLEAKSKIYKDPALCDVFLMNNGSYIVQKAKDRELETILGDDLIRKYAEKVRQLHVHYQRSSWNSVLETLNLDSTVSLPPNDLAKSMKEKLKSFNTMFEDICREQCSWFVFDGQLREEIRISLEEILLPAYGKFVERFQNVLEIDKHDDNLIKYGTEDIEARLNELFQGSSGNRK